MTINAYRTVMNGLERHAKLNGERDNVDYPRRLGTAEASLMIALNYVAAHVGEDVAHDLVKALSFEVVETEEKV
jgi:hypothetical protein